jgi:type IV pilus assembly protein PilE
MKPRPAGHTLLELLIATLIAALLAALATAGYTRFVDASRRADGRAALLALAAAQERHFLRHATYAERLAPPAEGASLPGAPAAAPPDNPAEVAWPDVSPQGHYRLGIASGGVNGYRLTATPQGVQARDEPCVLLLLDGTGHREARDADGSDATRRCWTGT